MTFLCEKNKGEDLFPYSYPQNSIFRSAFTYNTEKEFSNDYAINSQSDVNDIEDEANEKNEVLSIAEFIFIGLSLLLQFVNSFERLVVLRLGKAKSIRGPGTVFILPCIDKATRVDIRVISHVLPAVNIVTRDRGLVEFTAAIFLKVVDPIVSICSVQNKDEALHSLAYATLYKKLSKNTLADITTPASLNSILSKVQEELNKFAQNLGTEITEVTVTQIKILKQNENQAISLFNSLIKSDLGTKIMGTLETTLRESFINDQTVKGNEKLNNIVLKEENLPAPKKELLLHATDFDIDNLLGQLRHSCDESLVSRIGKIFIIRCEDAFGGPTEILLDLKNGRGTFEYLTSSISADVEITLKKDTLFALIKGSISPLSAYIDGSVVIKGSVSDVTTLKHLAARVKTTQ